MVRRILLTLLFVLPLSAQEVSPIQWLTWGDAAFAKAKREKKPILLSVGYASSFDTFRMRREAMATPENVKALNEWFVPVLLDRIEQPEIAAAYERVAASLARVQGSPANLVLTPDLAPYAAIGMADAAELQRFLVTNVNRWDGQKEKTVAEAKAARSSSATRNTPSTRLSATLPSTPSGRWPSPRSTTSSGAAGIGPRTTTPGSSRSSRRCCTTRP
jgi:uncharacterized protein